MEKTTSIFFLKRYGAPNKTDSFPEIVAIIRHGN